MTGALRRVFGSLLQRLRPLPDAAKMERFRDGMWQYEDKLVAMGAHAVDFALEELTSKRNAGTAAQVLGRIGVADEKVLSALREQVVNSTKPAYSCACALSALGDQDWLLSQIDNEATRGNAIVGLTAHLKSSWVRKCRSQLDYRPVEAVLDHGGPECVETLAEELAPGGDFPDITATEIDEVLRGMQSPHAIIRQHAVMVADARHLGATGATRLLPAVTERLRDESSTVRRLALLTIAFWKNAGQPYHAEAQQLADDPDSAVRATVAEHFHGR